MVQKGELVKVPLSLRRIGSTVAVAALVFVGVAGQAQAVPEVELGGLNLDAYCGSQGYDGATLVSHDAYGWRCRVGASHHGIDMHHACRWTYWRADTWAVALNTADPYSWRCYA